MAEHPNVQLLRDGYAAFSRGDIAEATKDWSDDIVWHIGGRSPLAGDYKGQEEVTGFFGKIFEMSEGNFEIEVHDILANDEHAVVLCHERARRNDKVLDADSTHVYHLKDGKVTEYWGVATDQRAEDEFWS